MKNNCHRNMNYGKISNNYIVIIENYVNIASFAYNGLA